MARVSRKNLLNQVQVEKTQDIKIYKTAIYTRLSIEDKRKSDDNSIENQIELIKQFIENKPYLKLVDIFSDNGASGRNFDRPAFIRMMEEIKSGKIDCIIVKDLSRFGRAYIETGNYLETIFPFLEVRFISVIDNIDTFDPNFQKESLVVALKTLIHDLYAKDISVKIKSALTTMRKNGEYIGKVAPYGYKLSETQRGKLLIDEGVSGVIKDIFNWKLQGMADLKIATTLNEMGIDCPSKYKYKNGLLRNEKYNKEIYWGACSIKRILRNQVYIGNMVQGKSESIDTSAGIKDTEKPKEDWIIVKNTHDPIVSADIFYEVEKIQLRTKNITKERYGNSKNYCKRTNILSGLLFCEVCGKSIQMKPMKSKNGSILHSYFCPYCRKHNKDLPKSLLDVTRLFEVLEKNIKHQVAMFVDFERIINKIRNSNSTQVKIKDIKKEVTLTKQNITKKGSMLQTIYEDFSDNFITKDEYQYAKEKYLNDKDALEQKLKELTSELAKYNDDFLTNNKYSNAINNFKRDFKISKELLFKLIEKIELGNDSSVIIHYKFKDEYLSLIEFAKQNGGDKLE